MKKIVKKIPRIIIASSKSGSGKTLISISLMKYFSMNKKKVNAFKCGPDFIDPMFHKKILELPSKNLDLFFTDEEKTKLIFAKENSSDISIIEGVMGLYDGLGSTTQKASTYHLAKTLNCPIIFVLDASGMALSILSELEGFFLSDKKNLIKGIILNNSSKMIFESLSPLIEKKFKTKVLGYFPKQKDLKIESRYLGLKLPYEIQNIKDLTKKSAETLSKTVDLNEIYKIAKNAPSLKIKIHAEKKSSKLASKKNQTFKNQQNQTLQNQIRIALAKDEAFCFYYEDNLNLLKNQGAQIVEFSPLHDKKLPENICGLILGGGYPELFAQELEENFEMKNSIVNAIKSGIPSLAECGGFMYLHKNLILKNKKSYKMLGIIDGDVYDKNKLVRFGYVSIKEKIPSFLKNNSVIKGHEFHYFDSTNNGSSCICEKPISKKNWESSFTGKNFWWGFTHLYYESNPDFAKNFVELCREFKNFDVNKNITTSFNSDEKDKNFCEKLFCQTEKKDEKFNEEIKTQNLENQNLSGKKSLSQKSQNYKFFQNTKCENFPCHKIEKLEDFNCLFCYCPLYFLGEKCGGNFYYTKSGIKSCKNCNFPHKRENFDEINLRLKEILKK